MRLSLDDLNVTAQRELLEGVADLFGLENARRIEALSPPGGGATRTESP